MKLLNILYEHIGESDAFIKSIQSLINHTVSNLKEEIEDMVAFILVSIPPDS